MRELHSLNGGFHDYLGDGVYASFDGYQIWLAANHHENKVVALDPEVFRALVRYAERLKEAIKEARETGGGDAKP
jgi:hypothetical protein